MLHLRYQTRKIIGKKCRKIKNLDSTQFLTPFPFLFCFLFKENFALFKQLNIANKFMRES